MKNLYNQNLKLQVSEKRKKNLFSNEQNRPIEIEMSAFDK
jgi:hypothetical protein